LPIHPPYPPMESRAVDQIPVGENWQYEPKWDGFRCLAFRDGSKIELQSKSGQPLTRYFPELVETLAGLDAKSFVLDGEIVIPVSGQLSFDQLLQRIHPAESRIRKLAKEFPCLYILFDLLVTDTRKSIVDEPLSTRRTQLELFYKKHIPRDSRLRLSPATTQIKVAQKWFSSPGSALDGIVAKRLDLPYLSGSRDGMQKIKHKRTADCVVAGFRYGSKATTTLGSLLLGLYDDNKILHHVGFCSSFTQTQRKDLTPKIERLKLPITKGGGFTGRSPGGPSRWSTERSGEWEPLAPKLVVEVQYDNFANGRFRHGTAFQRFRPDKSPAQCTMDQVESSSRAAFNLLSA
jgi:ATP-dependent DNA ligase